MKRDLEQEHEVISSKLVEEFKSFKTETIKGILKLNEEINSIRQNLMQNPLEYDLVLLNGEYSFPECFLIPTTNLTEEHISLLQFATECGTLESNLFYCLDQIIFTSDSKEEKKRKKDLAKEHNWSGFEIADEYKPTFSETREEAVLRNKKFQQACKLFHDHDKQWAWGPFGKFVRPASSIQNCRIRKTYMWINVV